jgi:hypothetical protein
MSSSETTKKPLPWKKIIIGVVVLIVVIAIISSFAGGSSGVPLFSTSTYTIQVTGTSGVQFSGSYMVTDSGGSSTSQSVDGTVPQTYTVTGTIVSVVFQNQGDSGTLSVQILKDSTVVKQATTTAAYGVVSVATD